MGLSLRELDPVIIDHSSDASIQTAAEGGAEDSKVNPLRLSTSSTATDDISLSEVMQKQNVSKQRLVTIPLALEYFAMAPGIHAVGGLRILVLVDTWSQDAGDEVEQFEGSAGLSPCSILETAIVAEVLVESRQIGIP
jgi:hypothetical protein